MLTWIVNLPAARRKLLAISLLVLVVLLLGLTIHAMATRLFGANERITEQRHVAGRMLAIAELKPMLLQAAGETDGQSLDGYFPGDTVAMVRAAMQTRLNEIADLNEASLQSVSNAPERLVDGTRFIGIRADLSGTVPAIHGTLFEIEANRPAFIVREASIWGNGGDSFTSGHVPPEITAQFHIYVPLKLDLDQENAESDE